MKIKLIILLFIAVILSSCSPDDKNIDLTKEINARTFELKTPEGWELIEEQGIDTYSGRITNGEENIYFDQGYFAFGTLENIEESENTLSFSQLDINDVPAIIEKRSFTEEPDTEVILILYIDNGVMKNKLYIKDPKNEELIIEIFKTHKFIETR